MSTEPKTPTGPADAPTGTQAWQTTAAAAGVDHLKATLSQEQAEFFFEFSSGALSVEDLSLPEDTFYTTRIGSDTDAGKIKIGRYYLDRSLWEYAWNADTGQVTELTLSIPTQCD